MKEVIREIEALLRNHEERISKLEALGEPSGEEEYKRAGKKKLSLKEFLKQKKPKSYTEIALAIGFYLEKHEGLSSFTAKDIENGFSAAKEKPPKNVNDTVNINVKNAHMMDCKARKDARKAWVLTRSGEDYVESGFKKEKP